VIGSTGFISPRGDDGHGAERQAERLREEGVEVTDAGGAGVGVRGGGRLRVDMKVYGWFPEEVEGNGQ
jgi:methylated-DNA-protein-cysteine methyltransferase-like protein